MNDRELLEMSAKACGIEIATWSNCQAGGFQAQEGARGKFWNPLDDDGDAMRLLTKLNLEIGRSKLAGRAYVGLVGEAPWVECVNDEQDIYACTRRAIVCASAEIGRGM